MSIHPFCPFSKSIRGFSLVEISLALGITLFTLIPLLGLITSGVRSNSDTYESFMAASLLTEVCAELQNTPDGYAPSTTEATHVPILKTANLSLTAPFSAPVGNQFIERRFYGWNETKGAYEFSEKESIYSNFRIEITYPEVSEEKGVMKYRRIHVAVIWPPPLGAMNLDPKSLRVESMIICIGAG